MGYPSFNVGDVLTAADMNAVGLWKVTPTSVAGTGVTLVGNEVRFTNSNSIIVNGCFTSSFRNYKIIGSGAGVTSAGGGELRLRMRVGGVTNANNNYHVQGINSNQNAGISANNIANGSFFYLCSYHTTYDGGWMFDTVITNPQRNDVRTGYTNVTWFEWAGPDYYYRSTAGVMTVNTAYDSLEIVANTNNVSGRFTIYGYN